MSSIEKVRSTDGETIRFGDVGEWYSGGTPSRSIPEYWNGIVPWISPKDMKRFHLSDSLERITPAGAASGSRLVDAGTVLFVIRGMILAHTFPVGITTRPVTFNQDLKAVVCGKQTDCYFLAYSLLANEDRILGLASESSHGTKRFDLCDLKELELHHPSLAEQRRIAEILSTLDEAIERTEGLIGKLQQIKAGLMHDLFTRGVTPAGHLRPPRDQAPHLYKLSPLGWIPNEWEVKPLATFTMHDITYGIVQAGPHVENGVPYVRTGDMSGDSLVRSEMLCTSRRIADSYKRSEVRAGEIVCAIRATVGKVLIVPPDLDGANLTQGTARISPNAKTDPAFLLWAIRAERTQRTIAATIKGTTFSEITLGNLRQLPVAAPSTINEQIAIAARLDQCNDMIRAEHHHLAKLRQQKHGLMHDLLTGRVRVPVAAAAGGGSA
jgi:type I restriction enzyme S subunit